MAQDSGQPVWKQRLQERGILQAALDAGWDFLNWYGTPGWSFPLYQANGQKWVMPDNAGVARGRAAQRWKALDSNHNPKYLWGYPDQSRENGDVRQPVGCGYYWLPGGDTKQAIDSAGGVLIVACGEPDTLTFATVGKRNVVSFFGEGLIPDNAVDVFHKLGVRRIAYYPDNDNTGWDDALKLIEKFDGSGIEVDVYALPDEKAWTDVNDINDLWIACGFDKDEFLSTLDACKSINAALVRAAPVTQEYEDNDEAWRKYHEDIERALGAYWKRGGGWSKYMRCIFANHDHDDRNPKATYHKEKHVFRCFKCSQTWQGDQVAERLGIERPKSTPKQQPITPAKTANGAGQAAAPKPAIPVYTSDDSLRRYRERLRGLNPVEHVPFPFKALHHLGGFCQIIQTGKIVGVLGLSGGGKTSFIETLSDAWRQTGLNIIWWSPEWTWEEMADRAVQRWGGLSMIDMMLYERWLIEEAAGTPEHKRIGKPQPQAVIDHTIGITEAIEAWEGKAYYLDKMDVTLADLLDRAQQTVDDLAQDGRKPKIAVFDYIQLAEIAGARGDSERIPRAISLIKAFCSDNRIVGVVGTQTRKDDSEEARKEGELLTAEAAQYFRDDKTNLFITLNPEFDEQGNMTGKGIINVVKNSGGRRGKVPARPDPAHLRWNDVKLQYKTTDQVINESLVYPTEG